MAKRKRGCKHCGGLLIRIDGQWEHVSTDKLHPGLPPEPHEETNNVLANEPQSR